ncbi:ATP-binding protein [Streptomyces sp. TRM66268-LWL]|uniref:ATP-binding protein n=1 Tax=Streptomyces polyasparticus TaxID=2767826 RepID=A0ABR7SJA0_9ACTN|nr:ATP-binding protein [Streptomyces polyasparticus]
MEYTLPRAAASAGRARELTTAFLARPHCRVAVFDQRRVHEATLVVSELVANATEHGRSGCRLRLAVSADRVIVEVDDDNPDRPQVRSGEDLAERGRGLAIVRHLSDSLEFIGAGEGKTVRAVLAG